MDSPCKPVAPGEWIQPIRRGYLLACCDCGLVHKVNFRLVKRGNRNFIQLQAFREEAATRKQRKHDGVTIRPRKQV